MAFESGPGLAVLPGVIRSRGCFIVIWASAAFLAAPLIASGQDSRAGIIAADQAEKATRLFPRVPSRSEKLLLSAMEALAAQPDGFYPYFGSVYSGGGFTLGAGYRRFTGDRTNWNVAGLYSSKSYKLVEAVVASPGHASGKIDTRAIVGWRDATQVPFYGLGIDSATTGLATFRMQQSYAGGDFTFHPRKRINISAGVTYEEYELKNAPGELTSIEDVYTVATAPGLGENPNYIHTTISAGFDWRPAAEYARRGGLYEVARHGYRDRAETYSFDRLDVQVVQHLPILRENWVVSVRGQLQTTVGESDQVPYFLLPSLGSGSTLRGYSSWRFRDRHSLLLSGEWRWIPNRMGLDMALFYDAGMVANRLEAIAIRDLVADIGVGVRFHGPAATPLRIELAKGREGLHVVFAASAAF
jgi:Omp85 superfamily domain